MRNRLLYVLSLSLMFMLVLAACGGGTQPTGEPTGAPVTEATEDPSIEEEPTDAMPVEEPPAEEGSEPDSEAAMPGEGTTVNIGRATWDTGWFQAAIFASLLEELGYTVEDPQTLDNPAFYLGTAQGNLDFWPNGWFPLHNTFLENENVQGKVELVGYEARSGALQGYLIDKKTADELGITSLEDFKNPDIAAAFDSNGNGTADLIGCNAGWGCELVIEHHLDAYELRDSIEHIQGEYSTLMADTLARFQRGEPILFYTWTPNWTIAQLAPGSDVVWIGVPFESLPEDQGGTDVDTVAEGVEGCVADPCMMGFPPNDIRVVANSEFLNNNPAARTLFEQVEIPLADIAEQNTKMIVDGEDTEADIQRHAQEWIETNRDTVDQWLEAARTTSS